MAAQGKSHPEETRDVPSAHNGFAGIRSHHFGQTEVSVRDAIHSWKTPKTISSPLALVEPQHSL